METHSYFQLIGLRDNGVKEQKASKLMATFYEKTKVYFYIANAPSLSSVLLILNESTRLTFVHQRVTLIE